MLKPAPVLTPRPLQLKDAVRAEISEAHETYDVTGVPFFIIDDQFCFSGAQDSDTIVSLLERIQKKRSRS